MILFRKLALLSLVTALSSYGVQTKLQLDELADYSGAICRAKVITSQSFEKGDQAQIFTRIAFRTLEPLKGTFAETVKLEHPGGILNGRAEVYCGTCDFAPGKEYLLFIQQRDDQTLFALTHVPATAPDYAAQLDELRQSPADGIDLSDERYQYDTSIAATVGVLPGTTGYGSRFLQCDRGEPIEYLVDMDALPLGISSNQAMTALSNAFAAWEAETSLTFKFAGVESFGQSANTVAINDGRIRVQLHDSFGLITNPMVLGKGGRSYSYSVGTWPGGGLGGRVGTNEFDVTSYGYLVIEHTASSNSDPVTLEEVLTHELGHVFSLGHSSETENEADPYLAEAQMYYLVHKDGRGASLQAWDIDNILAFYPTNTPPYGYDRIIEAITQWPSPPAFSSGANQAGVTAYDKQGSAIAELLPDNLYTTNGGFVLTNDTVFFTPAGYYGDSPYTPGFFKGRCFVRMNDGVNKSPPVEIRVVSFNADSNGDLLQDSWASAYGVSGATSDPDDDGLTNYDEWLLQSDPTNAQSGLQAALDGTTLSWSTKDEELYQVQWTDSLTNGFTNLGNPQIAPGTNDTRDIEWSDQGFYRIQRVK